MPTNLILQYLKKHGEQLDCDIAEGTGIRLAAVRVQLAELATKCEIVACHSIRFNKGKKVEGTIYRIAGFTPPTSPGRKSKAQLTLS